MAEEAKKESKVKKFFRDYKSEFKKIVWPDKKDTLRESGIVIAAIVISGIVIFLLDTGFSSAIQALGKLA